MTVNDLIAELEKVRDKEADVLIYVNGSGIYEADSVNDEDNYITLSAH